MRRTLELPFPVDLRRSLRPLRVGKGDPTMLLGERAVIRATRTPDGPATIRADHEGDRIVAEAWGPGAEWVLEQAPALLGLLDDHSDFDPPVGLIRRLHREAPDVRMPRTGRVVEAHIPAVLGQRVSGFEAKRPYLQLVERFGEPAPGPGGLTLQPLPDRIAELPYYDLHLVGTEKKRADTLKRVCAHASRLEAAGLGGPGQLRERLEAIPGVGPWTSAEVARVAVGDADAVSVGDYHLKHLVCWALAREEQGSDGRMLELLEPYAPHRGRACLLLEDGHRNAQARRAPRQRIEPIAAR
jgi:3-methyladenine DNA glycosylase/8-oxoguanine DNA glycosylase